MLKLYTVHMAREPDSKCLAPFCVFHEKYLTVSDRKRKVTDMREDMIQTTKDMVKIPSIITRKEKKRSESI